MLLVRLIFQLRRNFQSQGVEPDEAGGGVLVAGFGYHRGNHIPTVAEFTSFSSVWPWFFVPSCRRENQFRAGRFGRRWRRVENVHHAPQHFDDGGFMSVEPVG